MLYLSTKAKYNKMPCVLLPMLNVVGVKGKESDRRCVGQLGTGVTDINMGSIQLVFVCRPVTFPAASLSRIDCTTGGKAKGGS